MRNSKIKRFGDLEAKGGVVAIVERETRGRGENEAKVKID